MGENTIMWKNSVVCDACRDMTNGICHKCGNIHLPLPPKFFKAGSRFKLYGLSHDHDVGVRDGRHLMQQPDTAKD